MYSLSLVFIFVVLFIRCWCIILCPDGCNCITSSTIVCSTSDRSWGRYKLLTYESVTFIKSCLTNFEAKQIFPRLKTFVIEDTSDCKLLDDGSIGNLQLQPVFNDKSTIPVVGISDVACPNSLPCPNCPPCFDCTKFLLSNCPAVPDCPEVVCETIATSPPKLPQLCQPCHPLIVSDCPEIVKDCPPCSSSSTLSVFPPEIVCKPCASQLKLKSEKSPICRPCEDCVINSSSTNGSYIQISLQKCNLALKSCINSTGYLSQCLRTKDLSIKNLNQTIFELDYDLRHYNISVVSLEQKNIILTQRLTKSNNQILLLTENISKLERNVDELQNKLKKLNQKFQSNIQAEFHCPVIVLGENFWLWLTLFCGWLMSCLANCCIFRKVRRGFRKLFPVSWQHHEVSVHEPEQTLQINELLDLNTPGTISIQY